MTTDTFVNRELWWLEGNRHLLEKAQEPAAPPLERLKSLAVISANLDEFFIGRIPALKQLIREADQTGTSPDGLPTVETLRAVAKAVHELADAQQRCFFHEVQPLLGRDGIVLLQPTEISGKQRTFLDEYFHRTVFPVLTPLAVGPSHPFPFLGNLCLCLLASIRPSTPSAFPHSELSIVHMPSQALPRFIALPDSHGRRVFMLLEDVIRLHLPTICNGYNIVSSHAIRVTRAANRPAPGRLADGVSGSAESSRSRPRSSAVRLQLDAHVPADILVLLRNELGLSDDDVYAGLGFVALSDLLHLHAALDVPPLPKPPPPRRPCYDSVNWLERRISVAHCPPRAFPGFLLFLAALLLAGCGYSFRGNLPGHIKTVAVPILKNKTQAPGIENVVTSAIVSAFSNGGRLKVVPVGEADSILEGEIIGYGVEGVSFDRNSTVQAYRLRVVLNVEFRDLRQNKTLWQEKALTQTSDFQVLGQVSDTIAREGGAASQAAADIGRKIVNSAVDLF